MISGAVRELWGEIKYTMAKSGYMIPGVHDKRLVLYHGLLIIQMYLYVEHLHTTTTRKSNTVLALLRSAEFKMFLALTHFNLY